MNDVVSRSPDPCGWLVRRAAHRAPAELQERLEEEWLADLAERAGTLARTRFALGCIWATQVIVAERPARLAAASTQGRLFFGSTEQFMGMSRRTSSFALVVGLHVAVFYACWMSLATRPAGPKPLQSLSNVLLEHTVPPVVRVPMLPPTLSRIPVPRPDNPDLPSIETTPDPVLGEIREDIAPLDNRALPPAHAVTRVVGAPASGFPNVDDFYPQTDVRAGNQGGVAVQVCIDPRGQVTGEPSVVQSSRFPKLDLAAVRLARAGSGHYRPTTEDGRPVASCFAYMVRFRLKN